MTTATRTNGRARVAIATEIHEHGLMDALLAISAEVPKLRRTEPGQVGSRTYLYVTLDALLDVVMPILIAHDLVWVTRPTMTDTGQPALRYRLTHVPSGEFEEDVMPLMGAQDSQGVGSALTYARRYALLAVLNLAPGEDDDGAAASVPQSGSTIPAAAQPTAAPAKAGGRPASAAQVKMLRAKARDAELTAGKFANVLKVAGGDEPCEWSDEDAAQRWADRALDRLPARLVDAVIEGIANVVPF